MQRKLTPEQEEVVAHPLGCHARVLAVAGSGKSTTMAHRIKHLVLECGFRPNAIQVLMFNALARKQFSSHLEKTGLPEPLQPTVHTFHSFSFQVIGEAIKIGYLPASTQFWLADKSELIWLTLKRSINELEKVRRIPPEAVDPEEALHAISLWKGSLIPPNRAGSYTVPNEPPIFPLKEFNYSQKCLNDGFARYGWPNTGDCREKNPIRLAPLNYSFNDLETRYKTYLTKFCSIKAGDLILIPADGQNRGDVHIGIALTVDRKKVLPYIEPRPNAYYYFHDIPKGDWYECAHRVNVSWARTEDGEFSIFHINATEEVVWILAFSQVKDLDGAIYHIAQKAGLF